MSENWTKGPWHIVSEKTENDAYWIGPEKFISIAEVRHGAADGGETSEIANANLIASAPELYEALKEERAYRHELTDVVVAYLSGKHDRDELVSFVIRHVDCATQRIVEMESSAALSKARGEKP